MAPGPSAWRLNKSDIAKVTSDLNAWKAQNAQLPKEEFNRLVEDEKKRLTRLIQEEKFNRNAAKQANTAGKKGAGAAPPVAMGSSSQDPSDVNREYYQQLTDDLATIRKYLGDVVKEKPVPIATTDTSLGGVQVRCFETTLRF